MIMGRGWLSPASEWRARRRSVAGSLTVFAGAFVVGMALLQGLVDERFGFQ
jgi:hypothetical protein